MKTFEEFKKIIIERCKANSACKPEFERVLKSENFQQLVKVLTDNFNWCCNTGTIDADLIEPMNEALKEFGLCANINVSGNCYCLASGSATVRASGSATVRAYDSATVEAYDSATVEAYGSATVRAFGSATVEAYDSATVRAYDSATVRASGSASILSFNTIEHKLSDYSICRYYYQREIVISGDWKVRNA